MITKIEFLIDEDGNQDLHIEDDGNVVKLMEAIKELNIALFNYNHGAYIFGDMLAAEYIAHHKNEREDKQ